MLLWGCWPRAGLPGDMVRPAQGGGGMFERILLAVDGSQPNRAAEAAAELAGRLGSEVRVLECPVLVIR